MPVYSGDNTGEFRQLTAVGDLLYAPYSFSLSFCCDLKFTTNSSQGTGSALAVIDTSTFKLSAVYPISVDYVQGFAVPTGSKDGYLSVTSGEDGELIRMDLSTGTETASAPIPAYGSLLASPDATTLYVYGSYQLYAIDVATLKVKNSSPLVCSGLAITPDGSYLYCATTGGVDILATSSLDVVGLIPAQSDGVSPGQPIVITK